VSDVKAPATLLPDNDKESASSAHKRKIMIGILSVVVLVALVTAMIYQYRVRFDDFTTLKAQIVNALAAKDDAALIQLAAHEFTVGQPEQGSGSTLVPDKKFITKFIYLAAPLHWSERMEDFENIRVLYPEHGTLQLTFTHAPSGWSWSGVQSVSTEEVAFLASDAPAASSDEKVFYQEILSEEAIGDEPSMDASPTNTAE
jgi:hypothetical protein